MDVIRVKTSAQNSVIDFRSLPVASAEKLAKKLGGYIELADGKEIVVHVAAGHFTEEMARISMFAKVVNHKYMINDRGLGEL